MTVPVTLDPSTVGQVLDRVARPDYARWADQVARSGYCLRPVRLRGRVQHRTPNGRTVVYSTDTEPDRVLLVRCGNRRAAACPSCSREYAADMWQLLYAGTVGGRKGVPDTIRAHPLVFATLTAPSFGPVHTTRTDPQGHGRCHPRRQQPQRVCEHGRPRSCTDVHDRTDPALGQPLCLECYDYGGHAAFNWHAPELWRRFTIALRRTLARRAGLTVTEFGRRARVSFAKVAEFQRRAVVHFHALIRLDGPGDGHTRPGVGLDAVELADAVTEAAASVRLAVELPGPDGGLRSVVLRFGTQTDAQPLNGGGTGGELTPERVAGYLAKYATKSAEDFGLGAHRITPDALPALGVSDHIARLVRTCWYLGDHDGYTGLRRWLHMLGFRGHFATKSRAYSTTLGAIRAERHTYRLAEATTATDTTDDPDDTTLVVASWQFTGLGHLTNGDLALAVSAAARAREHRELAREHRT